MALSQHYERKHPAATKPSSLEDRVNSERQNALRPHTSSYVKKGSPVKLTVFFLIIIIAVGVIAYAALNPPNQQRTKGIDVGSVAPDFTLTDTTGQAFTLPML